MIDKNIALYRKYRPLNFDQIIGQYFIVKTLKYSIIHNNIAHAYIFSGTRGSGKTSIAKIFAKAVNCIDFNNDVCNKCKNCIDINSNLNIDIIELDAASNNGVNEIKDLIDTVKYSPSQSKYKVYIIDEAHMLSTSAWNALLKTIEEPPQHVIFIFATTEFYKIPPTIVSRCQRYDFSKLSVKELEQLITYVADNENILISNNAKNKIALLSDGGARDCLSILDQLSSYTNKNINIEDVDNLFGLTSNIGLINLLNAINDCDSKQLFSILQNLNNKNADYLWMIQQLINFCLDKAIYIKTNDVNLISSVTTSELYEIKIEDFDKLLLIVEAFKMCYENIKKFGNPKFYFELTLLNMIKGNGIASIKTNEIQDIENNISNFNESKFDLENIFITTTVTNKYSKPNVNQETSINNLSSQQADNYNFNYMIDEQQGAINPYSKVNNIISEQNKNNVPNYDWQSIFMQIAFNNDVEIKKIDKSHLDQIKNDPIVSNNIDSLLKNIEMILVSSKNGLVVLFNYKNEADKFNNYFWQEETYHKICEKLKIYNRLIFAIDKKQANEWLSIYKENKEKQYSDVEISLLKYSDNNDQKEDITQKILDILK